MSSDLISIVFQIMHFRANVWDRESFRDKGRKKGRKKREKEKKRGRGMKQEEARCDVRARHCQLS